MSLKPTIKKDNMMLIDQEERITFEAHDKLVVDKYRFDLSSNENKLVSFALPRRYFVVLICVLEIIYDKMSPNLL